LVTRSSRASLWLMCAAMVCVVALKPDRAAWPHWNLVGWPLMAASLLLSRRHPDRSWAKTCVLLAWTIAVLWFTRIDGDTSNGHALELVLSLGIGILVVPALAARYWLRRPLDYSWVSGRWSLKMILWLIAGFLLAYAVLWLYFNRWQPTLHTSWNLAAYADRREALWRLFWGCNFVGVWDELAFINFVLILLWRHFSFWEANLAQAVFFTSFLYEMAFFGVGPLLIYPFALIQGYTYRRTRSLLYIILLHLSIDSILFYMIANGWYPGWGWHP
jgi:membrane protease YdiL (CAAX protease family)